MAFKIIKWIGYDTSDYLSPIIDKDNLIGIAQTIGGCWFDSTLLCFSVLARFLTYLVPILTQFLTLFKSPLRAFLTCNTALS